jgi:hypothetical protein
MHSGPAVVSGCNGGGIYCSGFTVCQNESRSSRLFSLRDTGLLTFLCVNQRMKVKACISNIVVNPRSKLKAMKDIYVLLP